MSCGSFATYRRQRKSLQGMGHTLLTFPDIDAALAFYKDLLGFRISDFMVAPLKAYFMHVNARATTAPPSSRHWFAACITCSSSTISLTMSGRVTICCRIPRRKSSLRSSANPNDLMTSYYMRTPSEIYVECGWGGREVDDAKPPVEMTTVGLFEDIGAPPSAVPDAGTRRAPVQVIEGTYQRMAGICSWWEQTRGKTR